MLVHYIVVKWAKYTSVSESWRPFVSASEVWVIHRTDLLTHTKPSLSYLHVGSRIFALRVHRYEYGPWLDIIQKDLPNQPNVSVFAFEHYGRSVKKPEYNNIHIDSETLTRLAKGIPAAFVDTKVCFFCWDPVE